MEVLGLYVPTWLLLLFFSALLIYIWLTRRYGELKALGIPHPPPGLLTGNLSMMTGQPGLLKMDIKLREKYGDVWGFFEGRIPIIVVADVDIIKQIMVKDFNKFINRRKQPMRGEFRYGLLEARDNHWKHLRRLSSPAFSSGKVKYMSRQINQCVAQLRESLQEKAAQDTSFEGKQVCSAFTMDAIAAIAFGLRIDTQKDVHNQWMVQAKAFLDQATSPFSYFIKLFLFELMMLLDRLGVELPVRAPMRFFQDILKRTITERRNTSQPNDHVDFLQLMMEGESLLDYADEEVRKELKEGNLVAQDGRKEKGMTDQEVMAQSLLLLFAGYETTASTMAFAMYLLASHQEIQEKVLAEVQEVWGDKEELGHEDLNKLKYLDMCIEETLRIYPPFVRVNRMAQEEVMYKNIRIPKDFLVTIPIRALHYDPVVWPEPGKFDPNRFTPEAKAARSPYNYMPFGAGPRNCVGIRLAQMKLKMALAAVVKYFHLKVSSKCKQPLELENTFLIKAKGGLWLDVEAR